MNAITPRNTQAVAVIPSSLALPPLPESIAAHERAAAAHARVRARWEAATPEQRESMVVGIPPQRQELTAVDRRQAEAADQALHSQMAPVSLATLRAWLGPVNAAVRNPQTLEDFAQRCFSLHELLDDLPGAAFTAEARKALPGFFPSAADIREAVEPGARRMLAMKAALTAAMAYVPKPVETPEPRRARTPEEIAAVRATVQAFMAERNAAGGPAELPPVRPAYLTGEVLEQVRNACPLVKAAREMQARMAARQVPA